MPVYIIIILLVLFVTADVIIRQAFKAYKEKKARRERELVLNESLNLDFSIEALSLKRAEVQNPKARILCVDDENVILDSFRKILVLAGYSIDTVTSGKEALGLIQLHNYDFVFTDLKMPEMSGEDVCKSVKHMRPDIDVIIITGYATVESAVECMKYGAMDYLQKPFTEDELLEHVNEFIIKRTTRIKSKMKPPIHVVSDEDFSQGLSDELVIPGGVFISKSHVWASLTQDGKVKIGIDDFVNKVISEINGIEFPNLGMNVKAGQTLFNLNIGTKKMPFTSPLSGKVIRINEKLKNEIELLNESSYGENWVCLIEAENLDDELKELKIGKSAIAMFESDLDMLIYALKKFDTFSDEKEYKIGKNIFNLREKLSENQYFSVLYEIFSK
ncbi:MAG: histidine kinase [Ignavibacteriales bacterium CG_4_9_14_3_um_filter_34_10]|nr:MAG: histidine kinase [Ignavibacteriales bacterium CG_4_9_14_3_um_filter_34_10]